MTVYWDIQGVEHSANNVITVGTFDGIHLGHQFIIERLQARANALGATTSVITFDPHPQLVLRPTGKPEIKILTTTDEKIEIFEDLGLDKLFVLKFTREFANTSSEEFVREILHTRIGFKEIVLGHDHGFGKNREGDVQTLLALSQELGFHVTQLPAFTLNGTRISSTKIRQALLDGDVAAATRYLGRPYRLSGRVVRGDGRGKGLCFPTANLAPTFPDKLVPRDGVYAVRIHLRDEQFQGMMNIGVRPTFGNSRHTLEVHIFEFDGDLYGEEVTVEFVERIRDEIPFSDSEKLVNQLIKDKERSLEILQKEVRQCL